MGLMESLRNSTKYIFWVLLLSFGVLWGLSDTQMFDALMTGPRSLGEVNGQPISFEEYNQRLTNYLEGYRQETGGAQPTLEMRAFYEEMVWDELVLDRILNTEMKRLGISVTDDEILAMVTGPNPDPFITQYFLKEDGTVDRLALNAAIEAPENVEIWINVEQQLREKRRREKLNAYLDAALVITKADIVNEFVRENSVAEFKFVRFPYSSIDESQVTVSEAEINNWYKANKDEFKQDKSWNFRYVQFSKGATAQDTLRAVEEAKNLQALFTEAPSDSVFLAQNGSLTRTVSSTFQSEAELGSHLSQIFTIADGSVTNPVVHNGTVVMAKRIAARGRTARAAVFTMEIAADPFQTIGVQSDLAQDFSAFAENDGFEEEAGRQSLPVLTAFATDNTPFIPGIGNSRLMLNALKKAKRNEISQPVELDDRFIVFQITEILEAGPRPLTAVRAQIETRLRNDKRRELTAARVRELANGVATLEDLAAKDAKEVMMVMDQRLSGTAIVGAGREPGVVGAVFAAPVNAISKVIEGENAAFVVFVTNRVDADPANMPAGLDEMLRSRLQAEKAQGFREIWIERLKESAEIKDYRSLLLQ
jgi:peptidyl-prolyl cis-trans isomerase D